MKKRRYCFLKVRFFYEDGYICTRSKKFGNFYGAQGNYPKV